MIKRTISIDFSHKVGKLKPINSLNNGPRFGYDLELDLSEKYKEMSPPAVRLSSIEAPYSSSRYLDVHCIFPDFSLDERFPESYSFAPTDKLLASVKDIGADIFLRLGESREAPEVKKHTLPPCDLDKYARICSKIIAHYNKGWACGFKYNIRYVEIWCDADTPNGFVGSRDEYFSLYSRIANRIHEDFPKVKVGAYSSGGFFSLNHYNATDEEKGYVDFLDDFLTYITRTEKAPLDFLSWKCYAESPEELTLHANYARSYLGQYGLKKTQSIVTEFALRDTPVSYIDRSFPALFASSLIIAEKSSIDMMFLASSDPNSVWNPLYSVYDRSQIYLYSAYHVMAAFGTLCKMSGVVESTEDYRKELYSLAATDGNAGACVFTTAEYSGIIEIKLEGKKFDTYAIKGIIGGGERGSGFFTEERGLPVKNDTLSLRVGKNEVYFIRFYNRAK